ncbi:MAG: putative Ig domain-containing protein, partial [Magnetococcales bacterium]|nr:putative Ig domain-containing protein [Magnetococcales bacterium]
LGSFVVAVTATDRSGAAAVDTFVLTVSNVNYPPESIGLLPQFKGAGQAFNLSVASAFMDQDPLTYSATLVDGSPLPAWLQLDGDTGRLTSSALSAGQYAIQVTAVDTANARVSTAFTLSVGTPPTLLSPIPEQSGQQGQPLTFQVPAQLFQDADGWDRLTYSVVGAPTWLQFDTATRTFTGQPGSQDVGVSTVQLLATDLEGGQVTAPFQLTVTNVNDAPALDPGQPPLVAPAVTQDLPFQFVLPVARFTDDDLPFGDRLTYEARRADGTPLPGWLHFDAETHSFFGMATRADASVEIEFTAQDQAGARISERFTLPVVQLNAAPRVVQALPGQTASQEQPFRFQVDANSFRDADGETLRYAARLADGSALPAWLQFDGSTQTFSGTPRNGDVGSVTIKVTASDPAGAVAADTFVLEVADVNDRPTVQSPLSSRLAPVGTPLVIQAADVEAIFQDVDVGDRLSYRVTLQDGSALPGWLHFGGDDGDNSPYRGTPTLYGTPTANEIGLLLGIQLTATDRGGLSVSDNALILVTAPDVAPGKGAAIADKSATQGALFLYELPAAVHVADGVSPFVDPDLPNDQLTYSARQVDGRPLPAWLSFDADTRTFIGTPGNSDVTTATAPLRLQVTARDFAGMTVQSDPFTLTVANSNDAPTVATAIGRQAAFFDHPFRFTIPSQSFADGDIPYGDRLSFSVSQANGAALPAWLQFDASTATFSGTPLASDRGTLNLKVTATDSHQARVADIFSLSVRPFDNAPLLEKALPTLQRARQDQLFTLALDPTTFRDPDVGDLLTWSATLSSGAALPDWLFFDSASRTFIGTPRNADVKNWDVVVRATDRDGLSAQDGFRLLVDNVNDAPTLVAGRELVDQKVTLGAAPFRHTVDAATFADLDMGVDLRATLTLTATLLDGTPLTNNSAFWLHFDSATRTFSGTPAATDPKTVSIKVTATDNAATPLSASDIFNLTINTAPTTVGIAAPRHARQGQAFYFRVPNTTFQDGDAGDLLTLSATLLDGRPLPAWLTFNANTRTFVGTPGNADVGTLDVVVRATDTANASISAGFSLVVDNVNDAPLLAHTIDDQTVDIGQAFSLSLENRFSDADRGDALQLTATVMNMSSDSAAASWLRLSRDSTSGAYRFSGTAPDLPTDLVVKVTATDQAGAKAADIFNLHILPPNHAPTLQAAVSSTPQSVAQGQTFAMRIPQSLFLDPDGDLLRVTAAQANGAPLPGWLSFDADTGTLVGRPGNGDVGSLQIRLTATDPRGAQSLDGSRDTFTLTVTNVNDAPTLNAARAPTTQTVTQGSAFQFVIPEDRFVDADGVYGERLTYAAKRSGGGELPDWLHFESGTRRFYSDLEGPPASSGLGALSLRVTATDSGGLTVSDTVTLTLLPPNTAPVVQNRLVNQRIAEESTLTYQVPGITFYDPDPGEALVYSAASQAGGALPEWLHFDPATRTFFGTPINQMVDGQLVNQVGTVKVKVTATDSRGAAVSEQFDLTVENVNDAPTLFRPVAQQGRGLTAVRGSNFQLQLAADTFRDADSGDRLTLTATTPAWLTFDPESRTFSGTPGEGEVTANVKITATDEAGATGFDLFTLNVVALNQSPVVAQALAEQTVEQGALLSFQFAQESFSDPDGERLTYQATGVAEGVGLPAWLHFDADTRTFSGQPGNADVGRLGVKLIASDASGATATTTFHVVVANVNDAPTVAHPLVNQGVVQGRAFTYQFAANTFQDVDVGDALTFTATTLTGGALPSWLHFDPGTRTFTGQPTAGDVGTVNIRVTAEDAAHATVSDSFRLQVASSQSGILLDSKVVGVAYTASHLDPVTQVNQVTFTGLTDSTGAFQFQPGDTVTFSIGGIVLGQSSGESIITPVNLSGADNIAGVTNRLRLLQTLDADGNPDNGITITAAAHTAAAGKTLDFNVTPESFAASSVVGSYLTQAVNKSSLVSTESAWRHFLGTLANANSTDGLLTTSSSTLAPVSVAVEDTPFSYQMPATLFDTLTAGAKSFTATRLDGQATLPAWLSLDGDTGLFSGTPGNGDVGSLGLVVTATDASGASSSEMVDITVLNSNDAPTLRAGGIAAQSATLSRAFFFQLPTDTFVDGDSGDSLTFAAAQADGSPLPAWLSFDRDTGTFSGTPTAANAALGSLLVRVTASDSAAASVSGLFDLNVVRVNTAPGLNADSTVATVAAQSAREGNPFRLQLAGNMFVESDDGDRLAYTAGLAGSGDPSLPSWLHFDPDTLTFSGIPARQDVAALTVKVTATDLAGAKAFNSFSLDVQNTPHAPLLVNPISTQLQGLSFTQGAALRFSLDAQTFTVDPGDRLLMTASLADGSALSGVGLTFDSETATFTGTPTGGGVLHLKVTAEDVTNQLSTPHFFDWTIQAVNHAPTLNPSIALTPPNLLEGQSFAYTLPAGHFQDADNDALSYTASLLAGGRLPSWLTFDAVTHTFSGTPVNGSAGVVGVKVIAQDTAGATVAESFNLTVLPVNHAPTLNGALAPPDQAATVGRLFSFQVADGAFADGDAGDRLTFAATAQGGAPLPSWLTFDADTRGFSGLPGAGDTGRFEVTVMATDRGGLTVADSFAVTVADVNHAPARSSVALLGPALLVEGQALQFSLPGGLFVDTDAGDSLALSAVTMPSGAALPAWLAFDSNTGRFTGTPGAADVGTLGIKVMATDRGGLTAAESFSISVQAMNREPVIALPIASQRLQLPTAEQTPVEGASFLFKLAQGTFIDPNSGDLLTLSASNLPSWLRFDPGSRTFSGTAVAGTYRNIAVTATDSAATPLSVTDSFTLTVAPVNHAPTLVRSMGEQGSRQGSRFSFQIPATTFADVDVEAGRDQLTLTASSLSSNVALPQWLQFNSSSQTFSSSRILTNDDVGSFGVKVQATDTGGEKAFATFTLTVANVNDVPTFVPGNPIANAPPVSLGQPLVYTIPGTVFADEDSRHGDRLSFSAH